MGNNWAEQRMKRIVAAFFVLMICIPMMGAVLKGTVKDASGNPIQGASVMIDKASNYVVTNKQGGYKISVTDGEHKVAISMVGYETICENITISGTKHKDFIMHVQGDSFVNKGTSNYT